MCGCRKLVAPRDPTGYDQKHGEAGDGRDESLRHRSAAGKRKAAGRRRVVE